MLAAAVWALWAGALIEVTGQTACPAPAQVAAELQRLAPDSGGAGGSAGGEPAVRARAVLERAGEGPLSIELRDGSGQVLTRRELSLPASSCEELARAAALVLVVWERELRSGIVLPLALRPRPPVVVPAPRGPAVPFWPPAVELGAAFVASVALPGSDFAAGGRLDLRLGQRSVDGTGFGVHVGLQATGNRDVDLAGGGTASWTRLGPLLGAGYRFGLGRRVWLETQASVLLAATRIAGGKGLSEPVAVTAFDPGLAAEVRLGFPLGRVAPYIGVSALGWPIQQDLYNADPLGGARPIGHLPRFELLFVVGLNVRLNP